MPSPNNTEPESFAVNGMPGIAGQLFGFTPGMSPEQGRERARRILRAVSTWLLTQEPSSPVAVVLQQAERMIGMRYGELAQAIPLETFKQWESTPTP